MKNWFGIAAVIATVIVILSLGVACQVYKYNDCLKVGHSKAYCVLSVGR